MGTPAGVPDAVVGKRPGSIRLGTNRHRAADVIYCIQRLWGWFDIQRCTAGIAVWRFDLIHETVRRIDTVCAQSAFQRVGIVPFRINSQRAVLPVNGGCTRSVYGDTVNFGDYCIGRSRVVDQQVSIGCRTQAVDGVGVIGLDIQGIAGQQRQTAGGVKQEQIVTARQGDGVIR